MYTFILLLLCFCRIMFVDAMSQAPTRYTQMIERKTRIIKPIEYESNSEKITGIFIDQESFNDFKAQETLDMTMKFGWAMCGYCPASIALPTAILSVSTGSTPVLASIFVGASCFFLGLRECLQPLSAVTPRPKRISNSTWRELKEMSRFVCCYTPTIRELINDVHEEEDDDDDEI